MLGAASSISISMGRFTGLSFCQLKLLNRGRLVHIATTTNLRFRDAVSVPTPAKSQDILLQNMRSAKDSSDVLNAINRHHSIMNSTHAVQALKTLFVLQKGHSSLMSNGEVVGSKDFRKLCEVLKSQIRHIELNELLDVLKYLGYLGVAANSKILSLVLGLISKQVNELSLQQITFLDFLIKDYKRIPLIKALKIALPIVFEANLQTKCDFENVSQMSDLLNFVCKRNRMEKCADVLVDALTKKREELSVKDASNIVFSLCDAKFYIKNSQLLLCHTLDIITDDLDKIDFYEMESILSRLCTQHTESVGDVSYYHEEFVNGCCQLVIDKDYSFEHTLWILKKNNKLNHSHLPLLTHVAKKVEKEPWQLEQCGATGFITFLSAFSLADYKPPNWEIIKPLVIKAAQGLIGRQELPWLKLMLCMCIMDCWCEELFHKAFSRDFISSFMAREYNKLDRLQLLILDQVSATLSPWVVKPRAPPDIISPIKQLVGHHLASFPLQAALTQGLGGSQYVHTGILTPLGHFLDHVVVMRKGGYPVAINLSSETQERLSTEFIQVPPDSKMIAVLLVPPSMCAVNSERLRGLFRIQIDSIEALDIPVAPILLSVWNTLPDFERIPYLMRAIQEKLPSTEMTNVITPV